MAAKRHERTRARRGALQVLYTSEITEQHPSVVAESEVRLDDEGLLSEYGRKLILGVESHQAEIDEYLISTSENWSLSRMPIVDRSILRLATYEMVYVEEVPLSVTINEAVELAKSFGGEDESPRFVNGVLGRIAQRLEASEEKAVSPEEAEKAEDSAEGFSAEDLTNVACECDVCAESSKE